MYCNFSYYFIQDSNNEVITGKHLLTHYLFDNAKTVSSCIQVKKEITYVEQFKTDGI